MGQAIIYNRKIVIAMDFMNQTRNSWMKQFAVLVTQYLLTKLANVCANRQFECLFGHFSFRVWIKIIETKPTPVIQHNALFRLIVFDQQQQKKIPTISANLHVYSEIYSTILENAMEMVLIQ